MNSTSPAGNAALLIVLGSLVTIAAVITRWATGIDALNYAVGAGGLTQFTGWLLHGSRMRRQR